MAHADLVCVPSLQLGCSGGAVAMAVWKCTVVVSTSRGGLHVFQLCQGAWTQVCDISPHAMKGFHFLSGEAGVLAFDSSPRPGAALPLLFVAAAADGCVHALQLQPHHAHVVHVGCVGDAASVEACAVCVAVHAPCIVVGYMDRKVRLFRQQVMPPVVTTTTASWVLLWTVEVDYRIPGSARFTSDGTHAFMCTYRGGLLCLRRSDGARVSNVGLRQCSQWLDDVVEMTPLRQWCVCVDGQVRVWDGRSSDVSIHTLRDAPSRPAALAWMPDMGLLLCRDRVTGIHVFASPDVVAMRNMSPVRTAWMVATARSALRGLPVAPVS